MMSETQATLCMMFLLLAPLAGGGLALMNAVWAACAMPPIR